jgi:hypothetical protein
VPSSSPDEIPACAGTTILCPSGWFYDRTGSYDAAWAASIVLAIFAALIPLPIRDVPVARLQPA